MNDMLYERTILQTVLNRLKEPRNKMHILSGARQIGKTTLIHQALKKIDGPKIYAIAESGFSALWIEQQWSAARALSTTHADGVVLVIDEIQKIDQWSERVKRLFDEDTIQHKNVKVVLLGSSALLLKKGLTESMAGRFEIIPMTHWTYSECQEAFDLTLDEFIYFGAYPGAIPFRHDENRFFSYIQDAIIEPVVSRDIFSQHIIHKPALLRELFRLGCDYSSQILSFNKMLGQMQDAGNTTTLAHYLTLLEQSSVLMGIHKYIKEPLRKKQSSPKLQVFNTALQSSVIKTNFKQSMEDPEIKGRLVESAIGAYLLSHHNAHIYYWRENNKEVDFVVELHGKIIVIEVKSGKRITSIPGLELFDKKFSTDSKLLVGMGGIPLDVFLKTSLESFI
ncbi:MAG: ATP-binding protein [Alphaproteobacteria bacterium]|nr:ATP-binding protein [Alphaproteobacteria bacterium]